MKNHDSGHYKTHSSNKNGNADQNSNSTSRHRKKNYICHDRFGYTKRRNGTNIRHKTIWSRSVQQLRSRKSVNRSIHSRGKINQCNAGRTGRISGAGASGIRRRCYNNVRVYNIKRKKPDKKGVTEGTNEYNALIQATKDAEDAARAANEATKKADTAAEDANDAASAASRAEINANNASSVANSAAGAANATVGPAVNATEAANDAAKAANEAAKKAEAAAGGEISEKTVTFQEAVERANIESGDTLSVAFGKLAKYCADFEKVVENVNELNTNTLVTGTFSECWFPGFAIDGMGFSVIIPKHYKSHTLTVSSAKIFVPVSATWVPTTVSSITELVNCWRVILTTDASMKLTNGSAYIANLGGQIK